MNTRHTEDGAPFRQERFASSQEYQRGLMANLVVKRTAVLSDPKDRELIWSLQLLSHREGGLEKVADDLVKMFPDRIATPTMQKIGMRPGQKYGAENVRVIRQEIEESCVELPDYLPPFRTCDQWPLYGEGISAKPSEPRDRWDSSVEDYFGKMLAEELEYAWRNYEDSKAEARNHPESYSAEVFIKHCREHLPKLPTLLTVLCLDPQIVLSKFRPFFFPNLVESLREYLEHWIEERTGGFVTTEIGRRVSEALDYTLEERIMSLIDGLARIGKTFEAKKWCDAHPGQARYIQVPSSNDEVGFYRAIARALGVSINLNSKAHHLRDRVEDVLQSGQLMPVFDEAHFLWPTSNYRGALPKRVNWINTALVNHGVPVALITTPQFFLARGATVDKAHWNADQFDGRLKHYEALPDSLSEEDLAAVAESLLPEGDTSTIRGLVAYAQSSAKYLAGIDAVVSRARFLAKRAGRSRVLRADVKRAMDENVIPSEKALASAIDNADRKTRPRRGRRQLLTVLNADFNASKEPVEGATAEDEFTSQRLVAAREMQPANSGKTPVTLDA